VPISGPIPPPGPRPRATRPRRTRPPGHFGPQRLRRPNHSGRARLLDQSGATQAGGEDSTLNQFLMKNLLVDDQTRGFARISPAAWSRATVCSGDFQSDGQVREQRIDAASGGGSPGSCRQTLRTALGLNLRGGARSWRKPNPAFGTLKGSRRGPGIGPAMRGRERGSHGPNRNTPSRWIGSRQGSGFSHGQTL